MPYKDPEKRRAFHKEASRKWAELNPERRLETNRAYDRRRKGTEARKVSHAADRKRRHVRQRVAVIERYGGDCAFCGSTQYEHLTIDHINGEGSQHRLEIKQQYRGLTDYLYRTEYRPDLYRILCWNCHMAMTRHGVQPGGESLHDMEYWRAFGALRRRPNG